MNNLKLIKLIEFGSVLATRENGRSAADQIQDAAQGPGLVLSFAGVEIATPSFLDEVVARLAGLLHKNESLIVVITGLSDEVRHSLALVLADRHLSFAVLEDEQIKLLGGSRQLEETLVAAQELGSFKASELAEELKIKLPNLHQRLGALLEAGALVRQPDKSGGRGGPHDYATPDPKKLKKLVAA